jgi:uncharacterized protein HemY
VELDDEEAAERTLAEGVERAQRRSHGVARVDLLRVEGMLRSRQGRWEEAQRLLAEAIDGAHRMPDPYREAQSCAEMGVLAARRGDETAAREHGASALAMMQGIGALACAAYIERLIPQTSVEPCNHS